jgi:hypothetical protein
MPSRVARAFTGGGTEGNEQLTALTGAPLFVLLAVLGVTIVRVHQLMWLHLFLGLLLIGPVSLKMASTGYRFARYDTGDPVYRRKGPPETALRLIAPIVVLTTVVVFVSGIILMFNGTCSATWAPRGAGSPSRAPCSSRSSSSRTSASGRTPAHSTTTDRSSTTPRPRQ